MRPAPAVATAFEIEVKQLHLTAGTVRRLGGAAQMV